MSDNEMRKKFEKWVTKELDSSPDFTLIDEEEGFYDCTYIQRAWRGYQAAMQHCEAKALEQSAIQQAKIDDLTKELKISEDAGWHNFDNLQHITNHLISKDALLIIHEADDDPLNFSKNLCASFDAMQAKIDSLQAEVERWKDLSAKCVEVTKTTSDVDKFFRTELEEENEKLKEEIERLRQPISDEQIELIMGIDEFRMGFTLHDDVGLIEQKLRSILERK